MVGFEPGTYWKISWMVTCPAAILVILIASLYNLLTERMSYKRWNPETGSKDEDDYPGWACGLIIVLVLVAVICIPLFIVLHYFKLVNLNRFVRNNGNNCAEKDDFIATESRQPLTNI